MTPDKDIVTAEVVEVPKAERPECYAIVVFSSTCASFIGRPLWDLERAKDVAKTLTDSVLIRIPGSTTQPQPAAPGADAVEDLMRAIQEFDGWLESSWDEEHGYRLYAMEDCSVLLAEATASTYQVAAAACLAKIRGVK